MPLKSSGKSTEEVSTAAIRMVAFGVLEHELPFHVADLQLGDAPPQSYEIERLVKTEFEALGWFITRVVPGRNNNAFVLLGALVGHPKFRGRAEIGRGSLRDVCLKALEYLDAAPPASCVD